MQTPFFSMYRHPDFSARWPVLTALAVTICFAVAAYLPGLSGDFHLDDYPNLSGLSRFIELPTWGAAWLFITENQSGPFGRPIAMASFLIDAFAWPYDAGPFRITSLAIHLCNCLLLFLALSRISALHGETSPWPAFWIASLWLVSPANTATTLYVIQRMTLLSSFFMLLGLLIYLDGRIAYSAADNRGRVRMIAGLVIGAGIGCLAKENAATFPLFVLAFEFTVFSRDSATRFLRAWRFAMVVPYIYLLATHLIPWNKYVASFQWREFSWSERLLTEPLVLIAYARNTLTPETSRIGIFNDQFPTVRDLAESPDALIAILMLAAVFAIALHQRKTRPLLALGILTFFAAHALESTIFPLELYFEHRNYLASAALIALAYLAVRRTLKSSGRVLSALIGMLALILSGFLTYLIAIPWGDPTLSAIIWPGEFPGSVRVRQMAADTWGRQGQYLQAESQLKAGIEKNPEYVVLRLQSIRVRCAMNEDVSSELKGMRLMATSGIVDRSALDTLTELHEWATSGACPGLSVQAINAIATDLTKNPRTHKADFLAAFAWFIVAETHADLGQLGAALEALDRVESFRGETRTDFWRIVWSINNYDRPAAVRHYESMLKASTNDLNTVIPRPAELAVIARILAADRDTPQNVTLWVDPVKLENGMKGIEIKPMTDGSRRIVVAR